jgi:O-antigen/teichoic acid export membrane protein
LWRAAREGWLVNVLKNIASNWLLMTAALVATYVLVPFNIKTLGQEPYGVWLLITSMTGYLGFLTLGIPMATVRFIAASAAEKNYDEMNRIIGNCAGLYLIMGLASLVIGSVLLFVFDQIYDIPAPIRASARTALVVVVVSIAASFVGQLPQGILHAHHAFVARNVVALAVLIGRLGLILVFVSLRPLLSTVAWIQLAAMVLEVSCMSLVIRHRYPHVRVRLFAFSWTIVRRIFSFSIFALILGIGSQLMFLTDSLVIGGFLPMDHIPIYAVANNLTMYLMEFIVGIASVIMPMATTFEAQNDRDELKEMFLKWSKIAFSFSLLAGLYLYVLGPSFIGVWLGAHFEAPSGSVLRILMLSFFVFLPVRAVCVPTLMGIGKPARPAIAFLFAGLINLLLSILFVKRWGLLGVAWGTAIPTALFAGIMLIVTCRELGIPLSEYAKYVVGRAVLGVIPVTLSLIACERIFDVTGYAGLAAAGVAVVIIFSLIWFFFVYRNDRYTDLEAVLLQFRQRRAP